MLFRQAKRLCCFTPSFSVPLFSSLLRISPRCSTSLLPVSRISYSQLSPANRISCLTNRSRNIFRSCSVRNSVSSGRMRMRIS